MRIAEQKLVGLSLEGKTTNANGQSGIDCGNLWRKFLSEEIGSRISDKINEEVLAVYFNYEGDHTNSFSYFIGCKVRDFKNVPEGLSTLTIPVNEYQVFTAKGKMPDCIDEAWNAIWKSNMKRAYQFDFEVYGEKSIDWENAEVEIFLSV